MNNTIVWILTTFVIVTIILDLSTFILMKTNNKAYEQNGNNPRKGKAYWAYLAISRSAFAMTIAVIGLIGCFGFQALANLMIQHKNAAIYIITAYICIAIATATWYLTKRDIREEQQEYDANQDYETLPFETFINPKDEITVNKIGLWLLANILMSGCIITFAVIFIHV
jgi:flagellar basal body-associated protein FliL